MFSPTRLGIDPSEMNSIRTWSACGNEGDSCVVRLPADCVTDGNSIVRSETLGSSHCEATPLRFDMITVVNLGISVDLNEEEERKTVRRWGGWIENDS